MGAGREAATDAGELLLGGDLLCEQCCLDALDQTLEPADELRLGDSQFRLARGGVEIEIHSEVPETMFSGPSDSLHVSVFLLGEDEGVLSSSRQEVAAGPGDLTLRTWAGTDVRQVVVET